MKNIALGVLVLVGASASAATLRCGDTTVVFSAIDFNGYKTWNMGVKTPTEEAFGFPTAFGNRDLATYRLAADKNYDLVHDNRTRTYTFNGVACR